MKNFKNVALIVLVATALGFVCLGLMTFSAYKVAMVLMGSPESQSAGEEKFPDDGSTFSDPLGDEPTEGDQDAALAGQPANEASLENWQATVVLSGAKPGEILETANLGSHSVTVSIPKLDSATTRMINAYGVYCLEVYYHRNDDSELQPEFPKEPETSAVYYYIPRRVCPDGMATVTWDSTGEDAMLCWGTDLQTPEAYLMKMMVYCRKGHPKQVKSIYTEEGMGLGLDDGTVTQKVQGVYFTENSLIVEDPESSPFVL